MNSMDENSDQSPESVPEAEKPPSKPSSRHVSAGKRRRVFPVPAFLLILFALFAIFRIIIRPEETRPLLVIAGINVILTVLVLWAAWRGR